MAAGALCGILLAAPGESESCLKDPGESMGQMILSLKTIKVIHIM